MEIGIRLRLLIFYYANPNWTVRIHFGPVTSTQGSWDITQNSLLTDASAYTQRETHTTCAQHVNATVRAELLTDVQLRHPWVKTIADNMVSNDRKVLLIHRMNVLHLQGFNNLVFVGLTEWFWHFNGLTWSQFSFWLCDRRCLSFRCQSVNQSIDRDGRSGIWEWKKTPHASAIQHINLKRCVWVSTVEAVKKHLIHTLQYRCFVFFF